MITLKIPIVSILKVLFRIWQFLGTLTVVGLFFLVLLSAGITFTYEQIAYAWWWKFLMLLGCMFMFAEFFTATIFRKSIWD